MFICSRASECAILASSAEILTDTAVNDDAPEIVSFERERRFDHSCGRQTSVQYVLYNKEAVLDTHGPP